MWLADIYSEGDLLNDDYLLVHMPESELSDSYGYREKFLNYWDVTDRIEHLENVIERAKAEINLLKKYDDKLVGSVSWQQVTKYHTI